MRNKMSASTNQIHKRDNRGKDKSPNGWKAFDIKQRRKQQGLESENDSEAYPILSGSVATTKGLINKNGALFQKPFSSVVVAPKDFPSLMDMKNVGSEVSIEDYQKLNYFGDESLIDDILAGVNSNVDEALSLIEAMFSSENKDVDTKKVEYSGSDCKSFDKMDMIFINSAPSDFEASSVPIGDSWKSLPIEPEWEEDDVYLVHRKDAIKVIRSASRHSKAANDAYIKGDHVSAQRYSQIAKEEWIMAKKLNAKAAKKILNVRNCKNDLWTLDLHGLHALEAGDALRDRLQTIESLVSSSRSATLDGVNKESSLLAASVQNTDHVKMDKFGSSSTRPLCLQVITGSGNHSRGAAALPSAVQNFLNENGYHFDETRPGTFTIRPKFRKQ